MLYAYSIWRRLRCLRCSIVFIIVLLLLAASAKSEQYTRNQIGVITKILELNIGRNKSIFAASSTQQIFCPTTPHHNLLGLCSNHSYKYQSDATQPQLCRRSLMWAPWVATHLPHRSDKESVRSHICNVVFVIAALAQVIHHQSHANLISFQ